jgi:hypothetical protein
MRDRAAGHDPPDQFGTGIFPDPGIIRRSVAYEFYCELGVAVVTLIRARPPAVSSVSSILQSRAAAAGRAGPHRDRVPFPPGNPRDE